MYNLLNLLNDNRNKSGKIIFKKDILKTNKHKNIC